MKKYEVYEIPILKNSDPLPHALFGMTNCMGIVAIGKMTPDRLIEAYSNGIYPWMSTEQLIDVEPNFSSRIDPEELPYRTWHSTNPRHVLIPHKFYKSKSLEKSMRKYEVRFDTNFEEIIEMCRAVPRIYQGKEYGTWLDHEYVEQYTELHNRGYAHSVEVYSEGHLVGGLTGIGIGSMFYGDTKFHTMRDASKVALAHLVDMYGRIGGVIDCQETTDHIKSLGAGGIKLSTFLGLNQELQERKNPWDDITRKR